FRSNGPIAPAVAPTRPQPIICHGVHGPWPRKALDSSAVRPPTAIPARGPSAAPVTAAVMVTGWTLGMNANSTRPAVATAASAAISASSLLRLGPRSTAATPSTMQPTASSSTRLGLQALPGCGAQARRRLRCSRAAGGEPHLADEECALRQYAPRRGVGQHAAAGDGRDQGAGLSGEVGVVGDQADGGAIGGERAQQVGQRELPEAVHSPSGLVQQQR